MAGKRKEWTASEMGKKGGAAGTGEAKRQTPEHYARIQELSLEARRANAAKRKK